MRLNRKRKFFLNLIYFLGFLISFGIPFAYLGIIIKDNLQLQAGNSVVINSAFIGFGGMILLFLVYIKWIKKLFNRKLQALAVVNELGMYSAKPPLWNRLIKTIEYVYPFTMTQLFFTILKLIFTQYSIFEKLVNLNILLIEVLGTGAVIFLIADLVKISMMNRQKIEDALSTELKKDKLYLKRLKKNRKAELRALEIQRELEDLKHQ